MHLTLYVAVINWALGRPGHNALSFELFDGNEFTSNTVWSAVPSAAARTRQST